MNVKRFNALLAKKIKDREDVILEKYPLQYSKRSFRLLKIKSKKIEPDDNILLIQAGIHGDEIAGPTTILKYLNKIINYAHAREVKLIIYPLVNPSGYLLNTRYNIDHEEINNDYIRYELMDGSMTDDLPADAKFKKWYWSSDKKLGLKLPKETALMHQLLKKDPLLQIASALDLRQDYLIKMNKPAAYQYLLGHEKSYVNIIQNVSLVVPLLKNAKIGSGQPSAMGTDSAGSIIRHDGTFYDLFFRLGVPYNVTVETTGITPIKRACQVNLAWIYGLIDLIRASLPQEKSTTLFAQATLLPKKITPQSKVHLIHTSSPVQPSDIKDFNYSLAKIKKSFSHTKIFEVKKTELDPRYLAASEKERLTKFRRARKKVDWLLPIYGGTGALDIIRYFDDNDLKRIKKNRPVVSGFSDTVALINYFYFKLKLLTFHYANATATITHNNSRQFFEIIQGEKNSLSYWEKNYAWLSSKPNKSIEGVAIGGNLTTFNDLLDVCAIKVKSWKPYILFLEDIELNVEDLHRVIISMDEKGIFNNIRALVLGRFDEITVSRDYKKFNLIFGQKKKQDNTDHLFYYLLENTIISRKESGYPLYILKVKNLGHGVSKNNMIIPIGAKTKIHPDGRIEFIGPFVK